VGTGSGWRPYLGRLLGWGLLALAAAVAVVALARDLARRRDVQAAHPVEAGRLAVAGAEAPLAILRDRAGVPHVRAASERDAYFGLGFAHAQDRPAQLVWLRRAAQGTLAEVEGESALAGDVEARVLGFAHLGEAEAARVAPGARALLEAYAAGVNAGFIHWTTTPRLPLPPAVADLGGPGEPWRPADSLALGKLHAWGVAGTLEESLALSDLIQRFGGFDAAIFFPERSGLRVFPRPGEGPQEALRAPLRRRLGLLGPSVGSSAWVVGGAHTRSGKPLLAADSHFEPTVPAALYAAHLEGGELDVAGAGPPGVPVFWTGFTPSVAWASVQAPAVVSDLYVESLSQRSEGRYHDGDAWRPLAVRREEIAVRGGDTRVLEVAATRHGPLVGPLVGEGRPPLAVRWTGAEPGSAVEAFFRVPHARSASELRQALAPHHEPVLAVVLLDRSGEAGLQVAGSIPERALPASLLPVPGRDPDYEWRGRLAPERLPARTLVGGRGFAVAADGSLAPPGGAPIEWLWRPGERAARLEALLAAASAQGGLDIRTLLELQRDVRSERAGQLIGTAETLLGAARLAPPEREVADLLRDWDRQSGAESRGAAVYHVFVERLLRELFEPRMGRELLGRYLALGRVRPAELVRAVLAEAAAGGGRSGWSDPAVVREAVRRSLGGTWLQLSAELGTIRTKWSWGRLHQLRFRSLFAAGSGGALGPFPYPGEAASVQVADHRPLESFDVGTVATFRFAIDAGALDEALASLAPGESEHPGHLHRSDALLRWLPGRPSLLATSRLVVEETAAAELLLEPAAGTPAR
jgi:penicillin G amidase